MLVYKAEGAIALPETIKNVIDICKILDKGGLPSYIEIEFNDLKITVNEKSTPEVILRDTFHNLMYKYECQGGVKYPSFHNKNYWLEDINKLLT